MWRGGSLHFILFFLWQGWTSQAFFFQNLFTPPPNQVYSQMWTFHFKPCYRRREREAQQKMSTNIPHLDSLAFFEQISILCLYLTLDFLWLCGMWSWLDPVTAIAYWDKKQFTVPTHIWLLYLSLFISLFYRANVLRFDNIYFYTSYL